MKSTRISDRNDVQTVTVSVSASLVLCLSRGGGCAS